MRLRRRKAAWAWSGSAGSADREKDFLALMERLASLPPEEAGLLLVEVVEACKEAGVGTELLLPSEAWFLERQHERAVQALIEISAGEKNAEAMARWAWKTVQINSRAEIDQVAGERLRVA